jgi:hypothetical protein
MNRFFALQKMVKKKPKGRLEKDVQAGVIAYLEMRTDCWSWRSNTGGAFFGNFFVKFGKRGAPDIHGLQAPEGRFFVVECKREVGGGLSDDQKAWRDNFVNHGGLYIGPARSVDDVVAGLGPVRVHVVKIPMRKRAIRR